MKRRTTELEERLISANWKLVSKSYYGKKSQKVLSYTYQKDYGDFTANVILSPKRDKILCKEISNYGKDFVSLNDINALISRYGFIDQDLNIVLNNDSLSNEEVVSVCESLENE